LPWLLKPPQRRNGNQGSFPTVRAVGRLPWKPSPKRQPKELRQSAGWRVEGQPGSGNTAGPPRSNPAPFLSAKNWVVDKVSKPRKGRQARESQANLFAGQHSVGYWSISFVLVAQEAHERMSSDTDEKGDSPREVKPRRVAVSGSASALPETRDARRDQSPEVEVFGSTTRGQKASERTYSSAGGNRP
jgi:hypothetical protein